MEEKWEKMGKSGKIRSFFHFEGAMRFRGHFYRTLDQTSRLVLPADLRKILVTLEPEGRFILTTYDGCLVGFPKPNWLELEEKFSSLTNANRKMRDFRRLVLGGAEEIVPDNLGRVRLSRAQMDYAHLERDIIIVGQGNRFEIWDQTTFKALLEQNFDDVTDCLAAEGMELGL